MLFLEILIHVLLGTSSVILKILWFIYLLISTHNISSYLMPILNQIRVLSCLIKWMLIVTLATNVWSVSCSVIFDINLKLKIKVYRSQSTRIVLFVKRCYVSRPSWFLSKHIIGIFRASITIYEMFRYSFVNWICIWYIITYWWSSFWRGSLSTFWLSCLLFYNFTIFDRFWWFHW